MYRTFCLYVGKNTTQHFESFRQPIKICENAWAFPMVSISQLGSSLGLCLCVGGWKSSNTKVQEKQMGHVESLLQHWVKSPYKSALRGTLHLHLNHFAPDQDLDTSTSLEKWFKWMKHGAARMSRQFQGSNRSQFRKLNSNHSHYHPMVSKRSAYHQING